MLPELESVKAELDQQMKIRSRIRKVMPEVLAFRNKGGKKLYEDVSEELQNAKELRELLEGSTERVIRRRPEQELQQHENRHKAKQQQQGGR